MLDRRRLLGSAAARARPLTAKPQAAALLSLPAPPPRRKLPVAWGLPRNPPAPQNRAAHRGAATFGSRELRKPDRWKPAAAKTAHRQHRSRSTRAKRAEFANLLRTGFSLHWELTPTLWGLPQGPTNAHGEYSPRLGTVAGCEICIEVLVWNRSAVGAAGSGFHPLDFSPTKT